MPHYVYDNTEKACTGCGLSKPLSEFHKQAGGKFGVSSRCKTCESTRHKNYFKDPENKTRHKVRQSEYHSRNPGRVSKHYKERQNKINALKARPCSDCGQLYPPYVMDFDHRGEMTKVAKVSQMWGHRWESVLLEISKCDVVCSNCHRVRTYERLQNRKAGGDLQ